MPAQQTVVNYLPLIQCHSFINLEAVSVRQMTRSLGLKKPHLAKQNSHVAFPCKISLSCCASYTTLGLPVSGWTHNAFCCVKSHDGSWLRTRQTPGDKHMFMLSPTACVMSCRRCPQLHPKMPRFKTYIHRTTSITRTRITRTKISFLLIKFH